jgi:hypothetical protein
MCLDLTCGCGIFNTKYASGDASCVHCTKSCSYIVSKIFDGGQYRSTDLLKMFFTGSEPL